ncbi:CerR family C-terminal domain-containing protein [Rhizobium sp. TH2]|uniref:CerR family C-terminal domain-containing protein n=1 Tax=Rhizobium sp. TH2 TaxID=2775403 RepID=UPI0021570482|nr:CerR family C-terminal domain-containing protein [Rhizobium sp. TH2]UVC07109.1 CerR family C-terminal domain-containing protein [Rhizobium sp. TH2]
MDKPVSGADVTRIALIEAAIRLFGERGYDAVSTREIADLAAANIGSIAYHFGGKPGLRLTCAQHVIGNISATVGPAFLKPLPPLRPDEALDMIERMMKVFCNFWLVNPNSAVFVNFILRELLVKGEVSELFYCNWMKPMHKRFCELFGIATGRDPESHEVKIAVFSFIGQVFHFRVGQPLIMRRLDWDELGDREADHVVEGLVKNTRAIVLAYRSFP